jgi:hypothetical protein
LLINASNTDNYIETRRTNATLRNDWNKKLKKETRSGLKLFRRCPPLSQRLFENIVLFSFLLQVQFKVTCVFVQWFLSLVLVLINLQTYSCSFIFIGSFEFIDTEGKKGILVELLFIKQQF